MTLFKLIEFDAPKERKRISVRGRYNTRQRAALLDLLDLFEAGEWQKCLDLVNDKNRFPYNEKGEYPEVEHICKEISDVLHDLPYHNYFTSEQALDLAREHLKKKP